MGKIFWRTKKRLEIAVLLEKTFLLRKIFRVHDTSFDAPSKTASDNVKLEILTCVKSFANCEKLKNFMRRSVYIALNELFLPHQGA